MRRIAFLVLTTALIFTLSCAQAPDNKSENGKVKKDDDQILIGFSMDTLKEHWVKDRELLERYAREMGAEVIVNVANSNDDLQQKQIDNFLTQGVDVLIIAPHNGQVMATAVERAKKQSVPVVASDSPEFWAVSAKMLITFLLTMRGTPYLYFGDEIGMTNIYFDKIEDYRDIMTHNLYELIRREGGDLEEFIESQKVIARDNGRTPMQWDDSENAGFTIGEPWLKVNPNYKKINVKAQERDENSILNTSAGWSDYARTRRF